MEQQAPQEMQNVDITVTMKLTEIDYIFSVITEKPYKEVGFIVDKLRQQILPQLPKPQAPAAPPIGPLEN
jgi:hypothetical protein